MDFTVDFIYCVNGTDACNSFILSEATGTGLVLSVFSFGVAPYTYVWSDGSTGETLTLPIDADGEYCVEVTDSQGCVAEACIDLTPPDPCFVNIFEEYNFNSVLLFAKGYGQTDDLTYEWSTGETNKKIKIDFTSQSYSANIFDASGCQTKVIVNFKTKNMLKDYSLTLNQESYMFSTPDNSDRSVIIEYTDKEGVFYTTSVLGQILPFEFNIQSVEDYETNKLGQPTWKIDSSFDCILFGENGNTKRIVDGKAVFAVAY